MRHWDGAYRPDGLRAWTGVIRPNAYYLYDRGEPVAELNETNGSFTLQALNTFGPNGLVSRTSAQSGTTQTTDYLYGPTGDVAIRVDENGNVRTTGGYDVYNGYGTLESGGPDSWDPFGWKGQYGYYTDRLAQINGQSLIALGHRYYDPIEPRDLVIIKKQRPASVTPLAWLGEGPGARGNPGAYRFTGS